MLMEVHIQVIPRSSIYLGDILGTLLEWLVMLQGAAWGLLYTPPSVDIPLHARE